jgi:hypothetical protein
LAKQTEPEKKAEFIQHGFIPENSDNLIDAGVRSVALIDFNMDDDDEPSNSASNRLRAITLKLRIMESTPEISRAVAEFETVLKKHDRSERNSNFVTWFFIVFIGIMLLIGCWIASIVTLG